MHEKNHKILDVGSICIDWHRKRKLFADLATLPNYGLPTPWTTLLKKEDLLTLLETKVGIQHYFLYLITIFKAIFALFITENLGLSKTKFKIRNHWYFADGSEPHMPTNAFSWS